MAPAFRGGFGSRVIGSGDDCASGVWFHTWAREACRRGVNPVWTDADWAPTGENLALDTPALGLGVLWAPATGAWGPVASYNAMMLLLPVLSAWAAFLLCGVVTGSWAARAAGGAIFGFSAYQWSQLSHTHTAATFLLPVMAWIAWRIRQGASPARWGAAGGAILGWQLWISLETAATAAVAGVVGILALAVTGGTRGWRADLGRWALAAASAGTVAAFLATPLLVAYVCAGADHVSRHPLAPHANDLWSLVIPHQRAWLGGEAFRAWASRFPGEGGAAYLGAPGLAAAALMVWGRRREREWRAAAAAALALTALSFGPVLHVGGRAVTQVPWAAAFDLPILNLAVPCRYTQYVFLVMAVMAAAWLGQEGRRRGAWALAAAGLACQAPWAGSPVWSSELAVPPFFASGEWRRHWEAGDNVLILPVRHEAEESGAFRARGAALVQAATGFEFRMALGHGSRVPYPFDRWGAAHAFADGRGSVGRDRAVREFLRQQNVRAVVVALPEPPGVSDLCRRLALKPVDAGGVRIYRISGK